MCVCGFIALIDTNHYSSAPCTSLVLLLTPLPLVINPFHVIKLFASSFELQHDSPSRQS